MQGQGVLIIRGAREQHRPATRQAQHTVTDRAQHDGRAVRQRVLDLDPLAGRGPAGADGDKDGAQDVIPGVQHAVSRDLLAQHVAHRLGVERHRGPTQTAYGGVRPGRREDLPDGAAFVAGEAPVETGQRCGRSRRARRLSACDAGRLAGRHAPHDEPAHGLQPYDVARRVTAVRPGSVSARTEAVAAIPGPQRGRCDAQPMGDRGDGQPRIVQTLHPIVAHLRRMRVGPRRHNSVPAQRTTWFTSQHGRSARVEQLVKRY